MISLHNLHIDSKAYILSNAHKFVVRNVCFAGCLSKYRRAFIVYMFRRPPEVFSWLSDNALVLRVRESAYEATVKWREKVSYIQQMGNNHHDTTRRCAEHYVNAMDII